MKLELSRVYDVYMLLGVVHHWMPLLVLTIAGLARLSPSLNTTAQVSLTLVGLSFTAQVSLTLVGLSFRWTTIVGLSFRWTTNNCCLNQ